MKKLVTLSAILVMGLSSYVFAADNAPVPPPKYPTTQDGQPRHDNKNADHKGERPNKGGKEWKHDGKSQNHDRGQPPKHDGKQPPKDGKKPPLPDDKR